MPNGIVETKNAYFNLETMECISAFNEPKNIANSHIKGLEDLRLYSKDDKLYFTATTVGEFIPGKIAIAHGEYDYANKTYKDCVGIESPIGSECEKNWVHVPGTSEFIYGWYPLRIGNIVGNKFKIGTTISVPPFFNLLRGSASPIEVNGKWLVLTHFVEYCQPRNYYHCIVELDKETYFPTKVSFPFVFQKTGIEFCISGRYLGNNELEFFASSWDRDPFKKSLNLSSLQWVKLIDQEPLKNNVVRVPSELTSYWDGGYSRCLAGNGIEQYINQSIIKHRLRVSAIFSQLDGLLSQKEYKRQIGIVGRVANISENNYYKLRTKKLKDTKSAIVTLCSRDFNPADMLLVPLDDDTFTHGLQKVLSNFKLPKWEERNPKVFWRGGSSGYDRPSARMEVTKKLFGNANADVRITKWGNWENEKDIPEEHFGDRCDLQKHFYNKYILIIDGNCIASNHQWVFGSGSVPIMITHPENNYWFKKFLKPMENYVPVQYDLSDLEEKLDWLIKNDDKAKQIAGNAVSFSNLVFSPEFQRKYIDSELLRISSLDESALESKMDWIESIVSAWTGHREFAEWITSEYKNPTIVELGVDYGYSTFVFANALKGTSGTMYGIDLFAGDVHAGFRNTYEGVMKNIKDHEVSNVEIIMGDFTHVSKLWSKPIDILHIDGLHTYEAVKNDFECWSKFVNEGGTILFHDTAIQSFGIKDFFRELDGGFKLYFVHSAGLGIYTKNEQMYKNILTNFSNVFDFSKKPF